MASNKDSGEVVKFMTLLAQLKDWCDNEPKCLFELAEQDEGVKILCIQLDQTASLLKMNERRHRQLFAAPVDPKFLTAWRDFEDRFQRPLADIWLADLCPELASIEPGQTSRTDLQWEYADRDGIKQASAMETALDFAHGEATSVWKDFPDDFVESIEDAGAAWTRLRHDFGFDLRGVFRRRELVPFVLVPRHVAAKHPPSETLSMLRNLREAHDAFVLGAHFAALALMRSILKAVLRDHYGAGGKDLSERINHANKRLPSGATAAALHRLRNLANALLHLDAEKSERFPKIEPIQLKKEIVSLLFVLRALIEGAPQWPTR
jgi:hypothetical protein